MRILITGAGGFLGKRLVRQYARRHEVFAATHARIDVTDLLQVRNVFDGFWPEVVIHCGAISDVNACSQNPVWSENVNVHGTKNLAMACKEYGARMIFCSSDQVYINEWTQEREASFWLPHSEEESLMPVPIYGQQKLEAERFCLQEQPDSVILRLTMLYDVPEETERKAQKGMFAENLKHQLLTNTPQAFYVSNYRGITDCKEVVRNMEKALTLKAGIYNFGSTNDQSMYDTMKRLFHEFGKEELVEPNHQGDRRNQLMDTRKTEQSGIPFETTDQGLQRYLKSEITQ